MNDIKVGDIREVFGGYGLKKVTDYDARFYVVGMQGHGPPNRRWFHQKHLGEAVGSVEVKLEWERAKARNVACNNPHCWCGDYRK